MPGLSGGVQIVHSGASLPDFDVHCPLLSLPLALKTGVSNIPGHIPVFAADPAKSRSWTDRLGEKTKRRVGLVWSGGIRPNQPVSVNRRRNIPLARLAALRHPAIEFYSLQKGQPGEMELAEFKRGNWDGPDILDYSSALNDFSDTAALMDNLDLVHHGRYRDRASGRRVGKAGLDTQSFRYLLAMVSRSTDQSLVSDSGTVPAGRTGIGMASLRASQPT